MSQFADKERLSTRSRNISVSEEFSSRIEGSVSLIRIFLKYRRTYRNYFNVFFHVVKKKYPAKGILKNGNQVKLTSFFQSYNLAQFQDHKDIIDYDIMTDTVTISRLANTATDSGRKLKFQGGLHNGEVVNIFLEDVYRILPVKGKLVLDIGANIGDSSIYFALRGASKVIGVEPFPENYEMAKKNVRLNNFTDRISVMLAGCSANAGYINISNGLKSGIASHTYDEDYKLGTNVPSLTLENILKEYNIQNGETILKMDCEGCEYDTILAASDTLLRQFSHMLIEYHDGYKDLKERLEKSAFEVSPIKLTGDPGGPTALPNIERPGEWYYIGYIYAKRR
jgi:FkbM family methyltransferase